MTGLAAIWHAEHVNLARLLDLLEKQVAAFHVGEQPNYDLMLDRTSYEGETIGVELPITVDMTVMATEPGFAGDTATGARKPATTETGLVVQVPLFVTEGDTIRIDTRTGEYQTRV